MPPKRQPRPDGVEFKFKFMEAQKRTFQYAKRGAGTYLTLRAPQCLEIGGIRSGKLLSVDELIPSPTGWKRNGDLIAGDIIYDETGTPCRVLIAHPPRFPEITYKITFDNGTEILAGDDHLWQTSTYKERKNSARRKESWRAERRKKRNTAGYSINLGKGIKDVPSHGIRTTQEIFETQRDRQMANHHIEICGALQAPEIDLPIDPYLLGLWLGDGSSSSGILYGEDADVREYLKHLPDYEFQKKEEDFAWRIIGLTKELNRLGVLNNKHIPTEYLRASVAQRQKLLAGLMDSDGSCSKSGRCEWTNTSKVLVEGVSELFCSLGIKHRFAPSRKFCWYKGEKKYSDGWRTSFTTAVPCFVLSRKLSRQKRIGLDGQSLRHHIMKVEKADQTLMRCLTVDSPSHLYLCSKAMIPTHNTTGKLLYYIQNYCLKFAHCDILVLRRTFSELESGVIQDFKTHVPKDLYTYNQTTHIATFHNGSRVVFAGCVNNRERDIEKYLGQSYPGILVDECGQFSPDAWMLLYSRNTVNAACEADEYGNFPVPSISGCTNPIGPYWEYYHTVFVLKEPWEREEGLRRAVDGSWWAPDAGSWRLVYDPRNYCYNHTTVLDNPIYIKERDPGIIDRLKALPPTKRKKMLEGLMDRVEGQYFDCFNEESHVVDLREDPEAIIWQDWQPVWGGEDWGIGHWNAFYLFTKALVRTKFGTDYRLKTVCFRELAPETTGHTDVSFADMINAVCYYPRLPEDHPQKERISGKRARPGTIYFSHEKFNRVMEAHSPADRYSSLLRERDLPAVTRGTMDRIGSASFIYNELKTGKLVILKSCPGIIMALPSLQRDPDNLDDVLKVDAKADDRYDAFRLGLYGQLRDRGRPQVEKDAEVAAKIEDPLARHFYLLKRKHENAKVTESFRQQDQPLWVSKV